MMPFDASAIPETFGLDVAPLQLLDALPSLLGLL